MKRVFPSQLQRNTSWKKQIGVRQVPEDKDLKNPKLVPFKSCPKGSVLDMTQFIRAMVVFGFFSINCLF